VTDNNGHIIETKYKIARGKCHLYTINLYHTKCSSLVNGKYVQQYLRFDLPEILSRMESWKKRNTTLNDISTCAKYFIMKVNTQATRKIDHKTPGNNTHSPLQMAAITPTDS